MMMILKEMIVTLPTAAAAPAIAPTLLLSGGAVVLSGGAVVLSGGAVVLSRGVVISGEAAGGNLFSKDVKKTDA